jgi:transcription termination factor Rho
MPKQDDSPTPLPKNGASRRGGGRARANGKPRPAGETEAPERPLTEDASEQEQVAEQAPAAPATDESAPRLDLADLKEMTITKLAAVAKAFEIPGAATMKKQELVFQILRAQAEKEA